MNFVRFSRLKTTALAVPMLLGVAIFTLGSVHATPAQGVILDSNAPNKIANHYVVVLKDGASITSSQNVRTAAAQLAKTYGGKVGFTYTTALHGFSVEMSEAQAKSLATNPNVAYMQQDKIARISDVQASPVWGLNRIDQRNLPLDTSYTYPTTAGNVTAYIIDTGVRISHSEFGGRAVNGYDFIDNDAVANDCNGHGTHVAGTVGGAKYGVAKGVKLVGVRVLNCQGTGSYAAIIKGVDWVTANATGLSVANMSLGGGKDTALNNAVANSISRGVTYAIAAGNDGANACNVSPASLPAAITVGATDSSDNRVSNNVWTSNYGSCLDIFAPGNAVTSSYYTSDTATTSMSGTSMATPHVAGAAALVRSLHPTYTPQQVRDYLVANATSNLVKNPGTGSPNKLLFVMQSDTTTPPPVDPPACGPFSNSNNYTISDLQTVVSPLTVAGCTGNGSTTAQVSVDIKHTWRGDVVIDLVAPDGTKYRLKNSSSNDSADNIVATYNVNLSSEARNGVWQLSVYDSVKNDTGYIDSWSIKP